MRAICRLLFLATAYCCLTVAVAQPICRVQKYDEDHGVPSNRITQLLQDNDGFMWFATWNGLCRYDGYEFQTFKPTVGDGCHMTTDRIRNITLLSDSLMLCQVDNDYYVFDLQTYRFRDLTTEEQQIDEKDIYHNRKSRSLQNREFFSWTDACQTRWKLNKAGVLAYTDTTSQQDIALPLSMPLRAQTFVMTDQRGNLWALGNDGICQLCTDVQRTRRLAIQPQSEVKCLFMDRQQRYWVATKDDRVVRLYDSRDDRLLGYLGSDGRLHQGYTTFGAAVYCMLQTVDGTLWLGTKPDGLFRLRPTSAESFETSHFTDIPYKEIYHLQTDHQGRLWVAALDGGVCYSDQPHAEHPTFKVPVHYPLKQCPRARYLLLTDNDLLLVATSSGLLVSRLAADADRMTFTLHQREPNRMESLSCSATMDVVQDAQGRFFIGTESGGVNQIVSDNLLSDTLRFRHIRDEFHVQPNDVVQSQTVTSNVGIMAVGSHLITLLDSTQQGKVLDANTFQSGYRFSEAHPLALPGGRWLFGLTDGAFIMAGNEMVRPAYNPHLVLTRISIQGGSDNWAVQHLDTLMLYPTGRSATIHFAALDYSHPERISYAFRLLTKGQDSSKEWNYVGQSRSATLLDLEPGTYRLEIRSTNADGQWIDNIRQLTIIVKPTFWEAWYGQLLIILLIFGIFAAIIYTLLYIRRIKRQQRETLEKYLAIIEVGGKNFDVRENQQLQEAPLTSLSAPLTSEIDPMLQRVMQFVEDNISNSDANVGDMADAAATSRSGLQRKLKQTMGVTPQDLMKEARIKRACQLLQQTDKSVSEIAYGCGFTDPKYFSRTFKKSTGTSPTDYRSQR